MEYLEEQHHNYYQRKEDSPTLISPGTFGEIKVFSPIKLEESLVDVYLHADRDMKTDTPTTTSLSPFGKLLGIGTFPSSDGTKELSSSQQSSPFGFAAENNIPDVISFEGKDFQLLPLRLPRQ